MRRPFAKALTAALLTMLIGQQVAASTPLWEYRAKQKLAKQAKSKKSSKMQPPPPEPPRISNETDRVMGKEARTLIQLFGQPVQDVREASARKLQFASDVCILDAYLYAAQEGGDPVVTYMSARVPDGRDAERNSCITALRQKR